MSKDYFKNFKFIYAYSNEFTNKLDKVLYIGKQEQKNDDFGRGYNHLNQNDRQYKKFRNIKYVLIAEVPADRSVDFCERYLIEKYRPKMNTLMNPDVNEKEEDELLLSEFESLDPEKYLNFYLFENKAESFKSIRYQIRKMKERYEKYAVGENTLLRITKDELMELFSPQELDEYICSIKGNVYFGNAYDFTNLYDSPTKIYRTESKTVSGSETYLHIGQEFLLKKEIKVGTRGKTASCKEICINWHGEKESLYYDENGEEGKADEIEITDTFKIDGFIDYYFTCSLKEYLENHEKILQREKIRFFKESIVHICKRIYEINPEAAEEIKPINLISGFRPFIRSYCDFKSDSLKLFHLFGMMSNVIRSNLNDMIGYDKTLNILIRKKIKDVAKENADDNESDGILEAFQNEIENRFVRRDRRNVATYYIKSLDLGWAFAYSMNIDSYENCKLLECDDIDFYWAEG